MKKLEFGTAGMRGILGPEEHELNLKHVQRVIEGYAKYLQKRYENDECKKIAVVIGRDNRRQSKEFAEAAASVLCEYKIHVYYTKEISPTPLISYLIKHTDAKGGINITASHNPKEYNGIKLYSEYGYQILPNEVDQIVSQFDNYENFPKKEYRFNFRNKYFQYVERTKKDLVRKYLNSLVRIAGNDDNFKNLTVAYSPLHGTGAKLVKRLFDKIKVKAIYDVKTMVEDSEFTYIKNPNPESPLAFERLLESSKKNKADLLIVTDPDSDRIGVGVRNEATGKYVLLTGNETALLTFNYLVSKAKDLKNYYLIYSFVSSTLPATIAKANGINVYETATGFKWIGELIQKIKRQDEKQEMLYAFEESYGSLIKADIAADKDALQGVAIIVRMANEYKKRSTNLLHVLEEIYQKYGYVVSQSITIDLDPNNPNQYHQIKERFKNLKMHHGKLIDYTNGKDHCAPSDMLKIEFNVNNRCDWIALRPSGTESKIKFYLFAVESRPEWAQDRFNWFLSEIQKITN